MGEREAPQNVDYSKMSPLELNQVFRKLYSYVPGILLISPDKSIIEGDGEREARSNRLSGLKSILLPKLKDLLTYSHLTSTEQKDILSSFENSFELGESDSFRDSHSEFYRWEDSGGIFDKTQAAEIDRRLYRAHVFLESEHNKFLEEWTKNNIRSREGLLVSMAESIDIWTKDMSSDEFEKFLEGWVIEMEKQFELGKEVHEVFDPNDERRVRELRQWRKEYIEKHGDEP